MKPLKTLEFGFVDAANYRRRENKDLFNRIFVKGEYLDELCEPNISFLIGEKGTGKTAYAVYLTNNFYKTYMPLLSLFVKPIIQNLFS
nr:fun domain protein [Neisseria meningitidis]